MCIRVNLRLSQQRLFFIPNIAVSMVLNITLTGREPEVTGITSRPMVCGRNEFQEGNSWRSVA